MKWINILLPKLSDFVTICQTFYAIICELGPFLVPDNQFSIEYNLIILQTNRKIFRSYTALIWHEISTSEKVREMLINQNYICMEAFSETFHIIILLQNNFCIIKSNVSFQSLGLLFFKSMKSLIISFWFSRIRKHKGSTELPDRIIP